MSTFTCAFLCRKLRLPCDSEGRRAPIEFEVWALFLDSWCVCGCGFWVKGLSTTLMFLRRPFSGLVVASEVLEEGLGNSSRYWMLRRVFEEGSIGLVFRLRLLKLLMLPRMLGWLLYF